MKYLTFCLLLLGLLAALTEKSHAQADNEVQLTIDTDCCCGGNNPPGKFGLYAYTKIPRYSNQFGDTLIRYLEIRDTQSLALNWGHYKLIYTPADSSKPANQYYFTLSPYEMNIHLNCFFFNQHYPSFLEAFDKRDTLLLRSTYFGPTNGATSIPSYTVIIFKNRKKYYASYGESAHYSHQVQPQPRYFPAVEPQMVLSEAQVQRLKAFEKEFLTYAIRDNLNYEAQATNFMWHKEKRVHFYSEKYLALLLWEILQEKEEDTE